MKMVKHQRQLRFLIGLFAVLTIFISLLRSSGYDFFTAETGLAIIFMIGFGTAIGLVTALCPKYVRLVIFSILIAITSNGLFRPFPTFDWLDVNEWVYPFLIFCASWVLLFIIKKKSTEVLSFVFFVLFLSSFIVVPFSSSWKWDVNPSPTKGKSELPPYIHIVLDQHGGVEAIPKELDQNRVLRNSLVRDYNDLGFKVYGGVTVPIDRTVHSFNRFLRFADEEISKHEYLFPEKLENRLQVENVLFSLLRETGYVVNVIQSAYMDVCRDTADNFLVNTCRTYPHSPFMDNLIGSSLSAIDKATVMINVVFRRTGVAAIFDRISDSGLGRKVGFPEWPISVCGFCISSFTVLKNFEDTISEIERGEAYFIHLLAPHDPYQFYADDCTMTFPIRFQASSVSNKFRKYSGQVYCTQKVLQDVLKELADHEATQDAVVIIHGDHGPPAWALGITRVPFDQNSTELGQAPYSAFFAVRAPGLYPEYDSSRIDLTSLLRDIVITGVIGQDR